MCNSNLSGEAQLLPSQDRDQLESNSELSDQGVLSDHEGEPGIVEHSL